jgi:hypothetical protein
MGTGKMRKWEGEKMGTGKMRKWEGEKMRILENRNVRG